MHLVKESDHSHDVPPVLMCKNFQTYNLCDIYLITIQSLCAKKLKIEFKRRHHFQDDREPLVSTALCLVIEACDRVKQSFQDHSKILRCIINQYLSNRFDRQLINIASSNQDSYLSP